MKTFTRLWLCLATVLACLPLGLRADNLTWQEATLIHPDKPVFTTFDLQTSPRETRWYKMEVKKGEWYETSSPAQDFQVYVRDGDELNRDVMGKCFSTTINPADPNWKTLFIHAKVDTTLYLSLTYEPYTTHMSNPFLWMLSRVTDNSVPAYATPIQVGQDITPESGQYWRYYRVTLEAGKKYYISSGFSYVTLSYEQDGVKRDYVLGQLFTAETTVTAEIIVYNAVEPKGRTFRIDELPTPTHTTPEAALPVELDREYTYAHQQAADFYYALPLQENRCYELLHSANFKSSRFTVQDPSGAAIDMNATYQTYNSYLLEAATTGAHLLRIFPPADINESSYFAQPYSFQLKEVTDARFWRHAQPIELGQRSVHLPKGQRGYWHKVSLQGGSLYSINFDEGNIFIDLYQEGQMDTPLETFAGTQLFTAPKTGTYYLRSRTPYNNTQDAYLTLSEVQAIAHGSPDKPLAIAVGDTLQADLTHYPTLYYKVSLKGGEAYELEPIKPSATYFLHFLLWDESHTTPLVLDRNTFYSYTFVAPQDGTYYIDIERTSEGLVDWTLRRVTDNRVMTHARPVDVMTHTYTVSPQENYSTGQNWYRLEADANVFYEIDCTANGPEDVLYVHRDTVQTNPYEVRAEKYLFRSLEPSTYYFCVKRQDGTQSFTFGLTVRRFDNRIADYATPIALGQDVQTAHHTLRYGVQWYKVPLEGGKTYELKATNSHVNTYLYRKNEEKNLLEALKVFSSLDKEIIYVPQDATYYIESRVQLWNYPITHEQTDYTWRIDPVPGDNRLPQFAEPLALGSPMPADFTTASERWYKIEAQAGALYELTEKNGRMPRYLDVYLNYDSLALHDIYIVSGKQRYLKAQHNATYYLKVRNGGKQACEYTLSEVQDNRSCRYATPIVLGSDPITAADLPSVGRWYRMEMVEGQYYQFDASQLANVNIDLYNECGEALPLFSATAENVLYTPTRSDSYLMHIHRGSYPPLTAPWTLPATRPTQGDDRLCQYATPVTNGQEGIAVPTAEGKYTHWYTVTAQKDKWYRARLLTSDGQKGTGTLTLYTACGQDAPQATYAGGTGLYHSDEDGTLYLKVNTRMAAQTLYWEEADPTGLVCEAPLPMQVGTTVTTPAVSDDTDAGATWYRFVAPKTGTYRLVLDKFSLFGARIHRFWNVAVLTDCRSFDPSTDSDVIAAAGHWGSSPSEVSFEAVAGRTYNVQVYRFLDSGMVPHTWSIQLADKQDCTLDVTLQDATGTPQLKMVDATLLLYVQTEEGIQLTDTLQYNPEGHYIAPHVNFGTYLLHFQPGTSSDSPYQPAWYRMASQWQQATPITVDDKVVAINFTLPSRPAPVVGTGSVTLEGDVTPVVGQDETISPEGIDINLYIEQFPAGAKGNMAAPQTRTASAATQAPAVTLRRAPLRADEWDDKWQFVTRTRTDAEGKYRIEQLPRGTYLVLVDLPGFTAEQAQVQVEATEDKTYTTPSFLINTEEMSIITTGILAPPAADADTARQPIYDLQGRQRTTLQRGINIVGRKKVIVK